MHTFFVSVFTQLASTEGFIVAVIVLSIIFFFQKSWRGFFSFLFVSTLFIATVGVLKTVIAAPRPLGTMVPVDLYGFPSGHAAGVTFIALAICIAAKRLPKIRRYFVYLTCALFAAAVGVSRVYFYAHTPLQVYGGYVLGAVFGLVWLLMYRQR